jgi:cellulose synthase/poly-beta-1,6-N-acetylglucosamine synthase-like glycosyltransferase
MDPFIQATDDSHCAPERGASVSKIRKSSAERAEKITVVALIPAHNEQDGIASAVGALNAQDCPPDKILVIADNCTDLTAQRAEGAGADVRPTLANRHKKAGALNQVIAQVLPTLADGDAVLVTDADSVLDADFVGNALRRLEAGYDAVGGVFRGTPGDGAVGHFQRLEYVRYAGDVNSLAGRTLVLTGTAVMFRVGALRDVIEARKAGRIPPGEGVYDTSVLTEDNELSLALKHLGKKLLSAPECTLVTEVMPTWRELWRQRERWKRGALENCFQYGITKITWRSYWGRQLLTLLGCIVSIAYMATIVYGLTAGAFHLYPAWLALTALFVVEHAVTVRRLGRKQMLASATLYEIPYEYFLQAVSVSAFAKSAVRRRTTW